MRSNEVTQSLTQQQHMHAQAHTHTAPHIRSQTQNDGRCNRLGDVCVHEFCI